MKRTNVAEVMDRIYFDGKTYDPDLDRDRLRTQLERVYALMLDGRFHSLAEIADKVGGSEASVSARLRDLRKPRFGSNSVRRMRVAGGLWVYCLVRNDHANLKTTQKAV